MNRKDRLINILYAAAALAITGFLFIAPWLMFER